VHKKFQEEAFYVTRAGTEELKTHNGGQTDRYSTERPKIKWACAKRLQEEALHTAKGAGAKEPTPRNGGQIRQALHWTPQDKVGMRKRSSKKKPSIQQGQELEDSSNE